MAIEIAQGLAYMHNRECLHRDLKAENVLLDSSHDTHNEEGESYFKCKIADFGLSRLVSKDGTPLCDVGSPWWRAPECSTGSYGLPADVFSFGVTLLEILLRETGLSCGYKDFEVTYFVRRGHSP